MLDSRRPDAENRMWLRGNSVQTGWRPPKFNLFHGPNPQMSEHDTAGKRSGAQLALELQSPEHAGEPPVRLRQSARARHLQIKVSPWQGIEIIVPRRRSAREVEQFLKANREWIRRAWRKLRTEYPQAGTLHLPERIHLPLLNASWKVKYVAGGRLQEREGLLVVPHQDNTLETAKRLQDWLKKKARPELASRMQPWCERIGLQPENISIRGQATRWGSCSAKGTISLNFRLLFLEKAEIDCLLLHELCHLKHMNHGKRFWALMEKHMPGARERDRELGEGWKLVPPWALVK